MKNKIAILGIADACVYAVTVALYIIFKSDMLLTVWETVTILSSPILLLILLEIYEVNNQTKPVLKSLTIVFMTGTILLTSAAHMVNITVTRKLMAEGIYIPSYFQIGCWPSVEMAIDYLAWGFFMGLAFIATAFSLRSAENAFRKIKIMLFGCGSLCLSGFIGTILINEDCWYLAPLGYGIGSIFVCIEMLKLQLTD